MPPLLPPPAVSSSNPSSVLSTSSSWSSSRPARPKTKVSTCQYKIGRVIGSGTFSVVKEAYHIQTGERFAAKVIPKQLLRGGKVQLLHNEVGILRHLSRGHPNLLQLHDCFETTHNVYLITELVTGGDLFDRLGRKGSFFESEAAVIIHAVVKALAYLHSQQVVHRDIKPENILFRNDRSDADLLIADFGLSVIMGDQNVQALKARCGTTGYMAPEILLHQPYGKPVDMWAVGVTTYLLLSGYLPFEPGYTPSGVPRPEVEDDSERDYAMIDDMFTYGDDLLFEPAGYWAGITPGAKHFIRGLIQTDPERRMTAEMALLHPWLATAATATTVSGQIEDPARTEPRLTKSEQWSGPSPLPYGVVPAVQPGTSPAAIQSRGFLKSVASMVPLGNWSFPTPPQSCISSPASTDSLGDTRARGTESILSAAPLPADSTRYPTASTTTYSVLSSSSSAANFSSPVTTAAATTTTTTPIGGVSGASVQGSTSPPLRAAMVAVPTITLPRLHNIPDTQLLQVASRRRSSSYEKYHELWAKVKATSTAADDVTSSDMDIDSSGSPTAPDDRPVFRRPQISCDTTRTTMPSPQAPKEPVLLTPTSSALLSPMALLRRPNNSSSSYSTDNDERDGKSGMRAPPSTPIPSYSHPVSTPNPSRISLQANRAGRHTPSFREGEDTAGSHESVMTDLDHHPEATTTRPPPDLRPRIFNPRRSLRRAIEVVRLCVALSQLVDSHIVDERTDNRPVHTMCHTPL